MRSLRLFPANRWLEPLLALVVIALNFYSFWYLYQYGYLPQPYFYQPFDVWMDWYNTAYWAHWRGAYDIWGTIYPPLSFVVMKPLTWGPCYTGSAGYAARTCDVYGAVSFHSIFLINLVLIYRTFRKVDRTTLWPRTIALGLGLPMTFALERGNILLLCFTAVLLAFGPLVRSARLRWFFAGCAINFKVYLVGALFAYLLHRRWRWFEGGLVATVLVYLVSLALLGDGLPTQIIRNIALYSGGFVAASPLDLWYPITYLPLLSLVEGRGFPAAGILGTHLVEMVQFYVPLLIRTVQATILVAALAAFLRPRVVSQHRLVLLAIGMALVASEAGGYTQMFLIFFVFLEGWKGALVKAAIIIAYILSAPFDIFLSAVPDTVAESFLGGRDVIARYGLGLMQLLRPGLVLLLCWLMALDTIVRIWQARSYLGPIGNLQQFIPIRRKPARAI